nr:hypothetical protein ISGA_08055 [Gordonia sp. NB41Y]
MTAIDPGDGVPVVVTGGGVDCVPAATGARTGSVAADAIVADSPAPPTTSAAVTGRAEDRRESWRRMILQGESGCVSASNSNPAGRR